LALWFLFGERRRLGGTPAVTVSQVREFFRRLLWRPPAAERIAAEVTRVLRRKGSSRIYDRQTASDGFAPRGGVAAMESREEWETNRYEDVGLHCLMVGSLLNY
jgi:hypothetical protein